MLNRLGVRGYNNISLSVYVLLEPLGQFSLKQCEEKHIVAVSFSAGEAREHSLVDTQLGASEHLDVI